MQQEGAGADYMDYVLEGVRHGARGGEVVVRPRTSGTALLVGILGGLAVLEAGENEGVGGSRVGGCGCRLGGRVVG